MRFIFSILSFKTASHDPLYNMSCQQNSEEPRQGKSHTHIHTKTFLATFSLREYRHLPDYNYRLGSLAGC